MVMIIVTLLGLSLGAVTQTEMLIGSRERNNQRAFYLAESGLNLAVARFMVSAEQRATRIEWDLPPAYDFSDSGGFGGVTLRGAARVSAIQPVSILPCQLCEQTSAEYEGGLKGVRIPITVRASMESQSGQILAQRRVSSLIDFAPWRGDFPDRTVGNQKDDIEFN